ncbi:sulfate permease [Marinomonas sp. SBI22]|uniref:SulP family inorganic anion transporter n=1 Tax=unclassified Marinomonas TaxID=196814 RepID=UPI0007AF84E5|nr:MULTISPECIES: SulP family inorganic anion transporter [unclassified Marinomonas]KZM40423.1 sulfate permease [Marinomonas sp. SBI8L]KZM43514.1 sulfate permease [Marinomonas sp. SBI22]
MSHKNQKHHAFINRYLPFLIWGKNLNKQSLIADFMAGLTGAVVVLPQGIAYALIAGLPPEYGLYTAIITPIIAALFGSSFHLISGPTAAISIVVFSVANNIANNTAIESSEFIGIVLTLTLLTGIIQYLFGLMRLGSLVNFISHTVIVGFTTGAALLIATSQFKYVLGVELASDNHFFASWWQLTQHLPETSFYTLSIALVTLVSIQLIKRFNPKLPAMLLGMIVGSLFTWLINGKDNGVPLVGELPNMIPQMSLPPLSFDLMTSLLPGAMAVAILGLVEALAIARAIGVRSGQRIEGDKEFMGQGLSNIVGSFFACYAGSGSFTRSGVNYDSGAKTPMAAIFAALLLILILLTIPQITEFLPLPVMAAAILLIAFNLVDITSIRHILSDKEESAILLVTFISTLTIALEFAIYFGVILSLILYLRRTSKPRIIELAPLSIEDNHNFRNVERFNLKTCPQIKTIRLDGSIYFASVDHIQETISALKPEKGGHTHFVLVCSGVNFIDFAGKEMLVKEIERIESLGGRLVFCGFKNTLMDDLNASGYLDLMTRENIYSDASQAVSSLMAELEHKRCETCTNRIFSVCPK